MPMDHVEHAGMMRGMVGVVMMMVMTVLAAASRLGGASLEEHCSGERQNRR